MELASDGSLADRAGRCTWSELRGWTLAVLDALTAIHARGYLHRDIKPENVLMCSEADARPGVKLTDFGVACKLDATRMKRAGTPEFWAPEQAAGDWRRAGPGTDLYALGRTLLAMAGPDPWKRLGSVGAEPFLRWLLEEEPSQRCQRAADARRALAKLPALEWGASHTPGALPDHRPSPPFPWLRSELPPSALPGVGSTLGRLRERPLVGRSEPQQQLGALVERPPPSRWVELVGPRGAGCGSLVEWLARRSIELGAADLIRVHESWVGTIAAILRTQRLEGEELRDQLRRELGWTSVEDLATWLEEHPGAPQGEQAAQLVAAVLSTLQNDRPWLVVLPGTPDEPLLQEVRGVAKASSQVRVLGRRRPSSPSAMDGAVQISVPALTREDLADLLDATLQLEPITRASLVDRASGNPQLLLELLWEGLETGLIRPGPAGFRVDRSQLPYLPQDLLQVAERRLAQLDREDPATRSLVWLAALLPPRFGPEQLLRAATALGLDEPEARLGDLVKARVLRISDQGARFATPGLRAAAQAALDRSPAEFQSAHAGAAADGMGLAITLPLRVTKGRLWMRAGRRAEARTLLLQTAADLIQRGRRLDLARDAALWVVELADGDQALRAQALVLASTAEERLGDAAAGLRTAIRAAEAARRSTDSAVLSRALGVCAYLLRQAGRQDDARRAATEALELARSHGTAADVRIACMHMAFLLVNSGSSHEAIELFDEAESLCSQENPGPAIDARLGRGSCLLELGRVEEAGHQAEATAELARAWGSLNHRAKSMNALGVSRQSRGDFQGAAEAYEEVIEVYRLMGVVQLTPKANLATIWIELGQDAKAVPLLRSVLPHARAMSQGPLVQAVHCFLLAALAGTGAWAEVDSCLDDLAEAREQVGFSERGLARFLDLAATRCTEAGQADRALGAWQEARHMWSQLDRQDRVDVADAAIAALLQTRPMKGE